MAELTQAAATEQLAAQIGELAEVLREMKATTNRTDRRGRWTTWLGSVAAVVIGALLVIVIMGQNERNDRAEQSRTILEAIQANQAVIQGCTSPGHPCYDENQARSNARLAPLIVKLCAAIPEGDPEKHRPPCPS